MIRLDIEGWPTLQGITYGANKLRTDNREPSTATVVVLAPDEMLIAAASESYLERNPQMQVVPTDHAVRELQERFEKHLQIKLRGYRDSTARGDIVLHLEGYYAGLL